MSLPRVAFIAVVNLFCGLAGAQDHKVLSLDEAFARALEKHPGLARFVHLREGGLRNSRPSRRGHRCAWNSTWRMRHARTRTLPSIPPRPLSAWRP